MNTKFTSSFRLLLFFGLSLLLISCAHRFPSGSRTPTEAFNGNPQTGYASWYGDQFNGKKTASGEVYDMYAMTAAHRNAPFGTNVRVTNLENGKQTMVSVNDRGPFVRGRIIDLSKKAAEEIEMVGTGTAKVRLEFLDKRPIEIPGDIYIQTGSFESQENAKSHQESLARGVPSVTTRIYNESGLYRVRSGPYPSEEKAQEELSLIKRSNFDGFILHTE